jgi:hypothetical protein
LRSARLVAAGSGTFHGRCRATFRGQPDVVVRRRFMGRPAGDDPAGRDVPDPGLPTYHSTRWPAADTKPTIGMCVWAQDRHYVNGTEESGESPDRSHARPAASTAVCGNRSPALVYLLAAGPLMIELAGEVFLMVGLHAAHVKYHITADCRQEVPDAHPILHGQPWRGPVADTAYEALAAVGAARLRLTTVLCYSRW